MKRARGGVCDLFTPTDWSHLKLCLNIAYCSGVAWTFTVVPQCFKIIAARLA